jgi:acetyl-CoA carboxylase biotin carboxyl carrier protein
MILTAKDIAEIAHLLDASHFSELRLEMGEFKLRISRGVASAREDLAADNNPAAAAAIVEAPLSRALSGGPGKGEIDVPAPLLGNFFHAPRPGEAPFVEPGDPVGEETTIGIIEVMKLMNPIRAGVAGKVVAFLAGDGSTVEKDQPLIRIETGS